MNLRTYKLGASFLACVFFLFNSCTQDEGIGGNSHIKGEIIEQYYNSDFTILQFEQAAKDEDVYILYGDNKEIGDNTTTSFSGNFKFQYLWPGNYLLYYYSDDTTSLSNEKVELTRQITLGKNENLDLGTLYTYKALNWNEGFAKIKGKIWLKNYKSNGIDYVVYPAQEQDVYITYNNAEFYTDRIRTQSDGTFEFNHLLKGNYKIFVYSEDVATGNNELLTKEILIEITELDEIKVTDDIYIEKS